MVLDMICVTHNSARWLDGFINSLLATDFDLCELNLFFFDNASADTTVDTLVKLNYNIGNRFGRFEIIQSAENLGFGAGNNAAVRAGSSLYLLLVNADTAFYPDTLSQLEKAINKDKNSDFVLWELRQFPYEHPKHYDVLTGEVSWASGAAVAIRRDAFEQIGGFDEKFFMYAEDVDISWRLRMAGYRLRYVPKAAIQHYCYQSGGEVKPLQYVYSAIGNLLLRSKFGTKKQRIEGALQCFEDYVLKNPPIEQGRSLFLKTYCSSAKSFRAAKRWREKNIHAPQYHFCFSGMDYERMRTGSFWFCQRAEPIEKVSVLVRTCGRPAVLREALISIQNQTYPKIEVIVAEDGPAISQTMIEQEFADLDVHYVASGSRTGRCVAGNKALAEATGTYCMFLDDDDVLYADHIETLVAALQSHPEYKAAYSLGFETPISVQSMDPYQYTIQDYISTLNEPFSRLEMIYHNLFPIQSVLFSRELYEKHGGFDVTMDILEDWDLWIRYVSKTAFLYVPKTTSLYRTPADPSERAARAERLAAATQQIRDRSKHVVFSLTGDEIDKELSCSAWLSEKSLPFEVPSRAPLSQRVAMKLFRFVKRILLFLVK